jgi:hypothetical protein
MANPNRGEIEYQCDGTTYKLSLSTNALAELQELTGMNPTKIGRALEPENYSVPIIKAVFWAALRDHQPKITMDDAANLLRHQTLNETAAIIGKLFERTFEHDQETGVRPTEARTNGSGANS